MNKKHIYQSLKEELTFKKKMDVIMSNIILLLLKTIFLQNCKQWKEKNLFHQILSFKINFQSLAENI